jgi:ABC-type bacteriocin/lantibiotic exporter with double-glycine peptidase domain
VSSGDAKGSLAERFPAVRRLGEARARRKRVPYVQQLHVTDCGAACLAMVLRYHGRDTTLDEVRNRLFAGRDGVNALAILECAGQFGLRGQAVRLDLEDLDYLKTGSILHWQMKHFVVLDRIGRKGVEIVDPAAGRRLIPHEDFGKAFTGVALQLEPSQGFEALARGESRVRRYVAKVLAHSGLLTRIVVVSLFAQVLALALPVLTGAVVDRVVPRADLHLLQVLGVGIAGITVFSFFASFLRAHLLLHLRTALDVQMTLDFLEHLLRLPFSYFQLRQTGDLVMRLNSNAAIREMLTSGAMSAVLDGLLVTGYLVVLLLTHAGMGLVVLALGALRIVIYLGTRRRYRELMTENLQAQAASSNFQVQMIEGIETLKTTGAERRALEQSSNLLVDVMNISIRRAKLAALVDSSLSALATASPLVLLGYGAHLTLQGELSLGTMLAMNALAAGFLGPLSSLVQTALQFQLLGSYVERVDDVLENAPEQQGTTTTAAPPLAGGIELRDVSFRYSEAAPWAVDGVSLQIPKGAQVAIVGRSGSGKSTLARLLVGLYEPVKGKILYDDRDLSHYEFGSIRRQVGFVPQYPFLFAGTIRTNIAMVDATTPLADIQRAAELAHIHDDILEMPLRYETPVASGGGSLAGGQRQRIALARALLRRPPILVLDEATSHLDALAERKIQQNLRALECTRIVIAHRLSSILDSDVILVMDRGRLVERGTHDELVARGGHYAELVGARAI